MDLSSNCISPKGVRSLFQWLINNESVYHLSLATIEGINRNIIGLQGVVMLSRCLKSNITLSILDLSSTSINNEEMLILLEGLKDNKSLTSLNLSNNKFDKTVIEQFSEAIVTTQIQILNLKDNQFENKGIITFAEFWFDEKSVNAINKLDFTNAEVTSEGSAKFLDMLSKSTIVNSLIYDKNPIKTDASIKSLGSVLSSNGFIKYMSLSKCELGDLGAEIIGVSIPK